MGRPFDWGKMIFNNMVNNISASTRNKFLMYPRFIQMLIDSCIDQIPHIGSTLELHEMTDAVGNHLKAERVQSGFSGRITPLFPYMLGIVEEAGEVVQAAPEQEAESKEENEAEKEMETEREEVALKELYDCQRNDEGSLQGLVVFDPRHPLKEEQSNDMNQYTLRLTMT